MKMEESRAKKLSEFLTADVDQAKELVQMKPEDALKVINAKGNDFTLEELVEFGEELRKVSADDTLKEEDLEQVSGGFTVITGLFVGTVCFAVGQRIGKYAPW